MTLKERRLNAGMSVRDLARLAKMTPAAIYYMERTGSRPRDAATGKLIADVFGVQPTDIWPVDPVKAAA